MNVYTKLVGLDGPNSFGIFLSYLGSINENFSTSQKLNLIAPNDAEFDIL